MTPYEPAMYPDSGAVVHVRGAKRTL